MAISLISFLGRGPYSSDGKRRDYWRTRYRFDDWVSNEASFFLHAVLQWFGARKRKTPDRLVILGTSGSMWDGLLLALDASREVDRLETFVLELACRVDEQKVTTEDICHLESELRRATGIEVHLAKVPAGVVMKEQAEVLAAMQRHVQTGDQVYLDVTNGYRHQPMLGLGAAVLLSRLRGAEIEEIFYGANDMRSATEPAAPVVSLRWLLDLFAWAEGLQQLQSGRLRGLTPLVRDGTLQKGLADTAFLLSTNQVHQAGEAAQACLTALREAGTDPILDLTRQEIEKALAAVIGAQRDARGILAVARSALLEQDYTRAAILLCESIQKHEQHTGEALDQQRSIEVKAVRNSLAHAARHSNASARNALASRKEMERTLQEQFQWVTTWIDGTS